MTRSPSTRRRFLTAAGVASAVGIAGYSRVLGDDEDIQDSNGVGTVGFGIGFERATRDDDLRVEPL